jgi:hypothetical protein
MRTTVFDLRSGGVVTDVREEPNWRPFEEYDGKPLERVRVQDLLEPTGALVQLVEIAKGGSFAMHSSPDVAFCRPSHSHDGGGAGPPDYCHRRDTRVVETPLAISMFLRRLAMLLLETTI